MSSRVEKQDIIDPVERIESLVTKFEKDFATAFILLINQIKSELDLEDIATLLEAGRAEEALAQVQRAVVKFSDTVVVGVVTAGQDTAEFLEDALKVFVSFDQTNFRAVNVMQENKVRLIGGLSNAQREATRAVLLDGVTRGLNPREQARRLRSSIGLTGYQVGAINRYRAALEANSLSALNRQLRDARFDATVRSAVLTDTPLTEAQIDRMVTRYTERQLKYRSEVIARTEALSAAHQGSDLMYRQAVDEGTLTLDELEREWHDADDKRVRHSHDSMGGQKRGLNEDFISGKGTRLAHPGDPKAPIDEIAQCRCILTVRMKRPDVENEV